MPMSRIELTHGTSSKLLNMQYNALLSLTTAPQSHSLERMIWVQAILCAVYCDMVLLPGGTTVAAQQKYSKYTDFSKLSLCL